MLIPKVDKYFNQDDNELDLQNDKDVEEAMKMKGINDLKNIHDPIFAPKPILTETDFT
jgi:hypothetical protein